MEQDLREVAVEINSIFDNMSLEVLNKIPVKIKRFFKEIESNTYNFTYDTTKSLDEQDIKEKTRGIIAWLYRDYICEENEKKEYNAIYSRYINEKEEEKRKLYNSNIIYKSKIENIDNNTNYSLKVVEGKQSIIRTIFNKILSFFKK